MASLVEEVLGAFSFLESERIIEDRVGENPSFWRDVGAINRFCAMGKA